MKRASLTRQLVCCAQFVRLAGPLSILMRHAMKTYKRLLLKGLRFVPRLALMPPSCQKLTRGNFLAKGGPKIWNLRIFPLFLVEFRHLEV